MRFSLYNMKDQSRFMSMICSIAMLLILAACSEKDDLTPDPEDPDTPTVQIPTDDVITTYIETSVATLGANFDESTERLIARARNGVSVTGTSANDIPEGIGVVFIDTQSLERIMTSFEDGDYREIVWLNHLFQNGSVLMLHKPDDIAASIFTLLMQWDSFVLNPDGSYSLAPSGLTELKSQKAEIRSQEAVKSRSEDNNNSLDLYGIRDGYHYYCVPNVYEDATEGSVSGTIDTQIDDDEVSTESFTSAITQTKPSAYNYGVIAEAGAEWINETSQEMQARGIEALKSRAGEVTGDIQYFDQISSVTVTIEKSTEFSTYVPNQFPITFSFWLSSMYNFDLDEDYYHVVMQEKVPAQQHYVGVFKTPNGYAMPGNKTWSPMISMNSDKGCGATIFDFLISTRWDYSNEYPLRDEWNIQPQGQGSPTTYESMTGWDLNADISFGKSVTGKLNAKYQSKETVTTTKGDVEVTSKSNVSAYGRDNWIQWHYVLGNQPYFTGSKGKAHDPVVPENASCRSEQKYSQSWNWMVKSTQKRANVPFDMPVCLEMKDYICLVATDFLKTSKKSITKDMYPQVSEFSIQLPVPERFKKVYSFTLDDSDNAAELSTLINVMEKVVPNFNGLFQTLQRTDDKGVLLGRTGVTMTDLENTVGAEWYALAKEIAARKFGVEHTYRFYVKDMSTPDGKLVMRTRENGAWRNMGVYVEVGPDGSRILTQEEADAEDAKKLNNKSRRR